MAGSVRVRPFLFLFFFLPEFEMNVITSSKVLLILRRPSELSAGGSPTIFFKTQIVSRAIESLLIIDNNEYKALVLSRQ